MDRIIFFFGSFDPLHNGHISILENAIKKVNANCLYLGLNKSSNKGVLTSFKHRYNMLKEYCKNKDYLHVLDFSFDYNNLDDTYKKIFSYLNHDTKAYILIGQDQLHTLKNWYKYDLLANIFDFIIAKRGYGEINDDDLNNPKYIFIDHDYKNISSTLIKEGNYNYTNVDITKYIIKHNLYLKTQVKKYLNPKRYKHTLSVLKTALYINRKAKLGLDKYTIEKAALLHDIGKNLDIEVSKKIINKNYPEASNENENILHQYVGEYIAKTNFYIDDSDILGAIKYHSSGRANMNLLEKLIYVSDKVEPLRNYNTKTYIDLCIKNFDKGFKIVLENNRRYLKENNIVITNSNTLECFKYYLD